MALEGSQAPLTLRAPEVSACRANVHGEQMAEAFPVVSLDTDTREAVELLVSRRLPGLIVIDEKGRPH